MNRKQRRKTASSARRVERRPSSPGADARPISAVSAIPANPSWLLRLIAWVVLSHWVLKRVRQPAVRSVLATIARQVGRHDLAAELDL
jgi:hypothetical protein